MCDFTRRKWAGRQVLKHLEKQGDKAFRKKDGKSDGPASPSPCTQGALKGPAGDAAGSTGALIGPASAQRPASPFPSETTQSRPVAQTVASPVAETTQSRPVTQTVASPEAETVVAKATVPWQSTAASVPGPVQPGSQSTVAKAFAQPRVVPALRAPEPPVRRRGNRGGRNLPWYNFMWEMHRLWR